VKHLKFRQLVGAEEKALANSKERAVSVARCSDSQKKLSYRRTSSVLTREHLNSLRLPVIKWHGSRDR